MSDSDSVEELVRELSSGARRVLFIGAMGFEDRALHLIGQIASSQVRGLVLAIQYARTDAGNRESEFRASVRASGIMPLTVIRYAAEQAHRFEIDFDRALKKAQLTESDLVVLDVSALSKFLILVCLLRLWSFGVAVKVVLTTAAHYAPTRSDFDRTMELDGGSVRVLAGQPSQGASAILRSSCLISARMQGQPSCAIAFTSFNEELIRHAVGTMNPHRLILINGMPPAPANAWRAYATQEIHSRLIDENLQDNPVDHATGLLVHTVSTLHHAETVELLDRLHREYGLYERMIYFATGSKMQTVALAIHKFRNDDVHIEYPNPNGYFFQEYSCGVGQVLSFTLAPPLST